MINKDFILGYGAGKANGGPKISIEPLSVSANGEYTATEGTAYSPVEVDVPNTYVAEDEGKVVSEGALVSQTSMSVTQNGVVDTTLVNSVDVNVIPEQEDGIITGKISGSYYNDRVDRVFSSVFQRHNSLVAVEMPNVGYIDTCAFSNCVSLRSVSFPRCSEIRASAFLACNKLSEVYFPICTELGSSAFYGAKLTELTEDNFPELVTIANYGFVSNSSLTKVILPKCESIGLNAFSRCISLSIASFPACINLSNAFYYCGRLTSLYFLGSSVVNLTNSNAFSTTPIGSSTGTIGYVYVPASLVETYQSATNWAQYSSHIVGLTDEEIAAL